MLVKDISNLLEQPGRLDMPCLRARVPAAANAHASSSCAFASAGCVPASASGSGGTPETGADLRTGRVVLYRDTALIEYVIIAGKRATVIIR
jgi:hypothetical protein